MGVREQLAMMRLIWPNFRCQVTGGLLVCTGRIQPCPITDTYTARIEYRVAGLPRTFITDPPLRRRQANQRIAHTYSDTELCLFTAADHDWTADQPIARSIVPWTYEWIVFYEAWLATGYWRGGGVIPGEGEHGRGRMRDVG